MSVEFDWKTELKDFTQLKVRDKVDWGELVRLQVNRCLMSLSDVEHPEMFARHVEGLLNLIAKEVWDEDFEKRVEGCTEEKEVEKPEYWCGVVLEPIPKVKKKVTDYRALFSACISKIQSLGMGMKIKEMAIIP